MKCENKQCKNKQKCLVGVAAILLLVIYFGYFVLGIGALWKKNYENNANLQMLDNFSKCNATAISNNILTKECGDFYQNDMKKILAEKKLPPGIKLSDITRKNELVKKLRRTEDGREINIEFENSEDWKKIIDDVEKK